MGIGDVEAVGGDAVPSFPPQEPSRPRQPLDLSVGGACGARFTPPGAPQHATDHNGIRLQDTCFPGAGPHHVFVIGDWGGITKGGAPPKPADHRSEIFPESMRGFVWGADDTAQQNVAQQMRLRGQTADPDYIINVGDNFYWGGIQKRCGATLYNTGDETGQWQRAFESVYTGPGIDNKQWLGILGNHDYGGYMFTAGWDQAIGYTWAQGTTGRWMTPALYWAVKVRYDDFSVDYYFTDSNVWDTFDISVEPMHNICSWMHNPPESSCGEQGPRSLVECPAWFKRLWADQMSWLENQLSQSTADWQVVVTHFPPEGSWGSGDWIRLANAHGIDLFLTGHTHHQKVMGPDHPENALRPSAYVVSGGGGGITSEGLPDATGNDDEYGFVDLTLSLSEIVIEAISHGGAIRSTTHLRQRPRGVRLI